MNPNNSQLYITPPPTFTDQPLSEPKKKSKLPIIIIAIIVVAIVIIAIMLIPKLLNKNQLNNPPEQTPDASKEEPAKVIKIHERLNISSAPSSFNGYVYDYDGNSYTLAEMREKLIREDGNYFFPDNPKDNIGMVSEDEWISSSAVYNRTLELFGAPNTIIESYHVVDDTEGKGYYGTATLIWRCGYYYVGMVVEDFTNNTTELYNYPTKGIIVSLLQIETNTNQWKELSSDNKYETYGKENL